MKKIVTLGLILIMALGIVGCSKKSEENHFTFTTWAAGTELEVLCMRHFYIFLHI